MDFRLRILSTLIFLVMAGSSHAGRYNPHISIGDPMPEFHDLPASDGTRISSIDIKEPIVVLVSLTTFCPWVRGMDEGLTELVMQFPRDHVRVIGFSVNTDDSLDAMKEHAAASGYTFAYVHDETQALGRSLGTTVTPEYFVYNQQRKLLYTGLLTDSPAMKTRGGSIRYINGSPTQFYVANAINAGLEGKPVDPSETQAHGCSTMYVR